MNNSNHHKNLIEKYLEGTIKENELTVLRQHMANCPQCNKEINEIDNMQTILNDSLVHGSLNMAAIKEKIQTAANLNEKQIRTHSVIFTARWTAIAASIMLIIGLFTGFEFAQFTNPDSSIKATLLPVRIGKLDGTVLVKHNGAGVWEQLSPSSDIYLGDTFCSTAKSNLTLLPDNKSKITLAANSTLVLAEFNGKTEIKLATGALSAELESPHGPFFVSTPQGQIEALGTVFTVSVE